MLELPAHSAFVKSVLPFAACTADTEHTVAHHQQSRLTYVHLLLKLYCFGAILTHLCCVRQQLRLCMHFVHSPPSPVPIGQSLLLCAHFGVILILCVYLRECLLQAPGCLSKLVRSTD